jgi:hypothetical protein
MRGLFSAESLGGKTDGILQQAIGKLTRIAPGRGI